MTFRVSGDLYEWMTNGFSKTIVVRADSELELLGLIAKAERTGVPFQDIVDAGLTEFKGVPTRTCVGFGPAEEDDLEPITGHLELL